LRSGGDSVWKRFNGGKEGTLWYYQSLAEHKWHDDLKNLSLELNNIVSEIKSLSGIIE
jgi:hypothetical protein